jgi:hypothetical protein
MRMNDSLPQKLYEKKIGKHSKWPKKNWSDAFKLIARKNAIEYFSKSSSWFQILHSSIC